MSNKKQLEVTDSNGNKTIVNGNFDNAVDVKIVPVKSTYWILMNPDRGTYEWLTEPLEKWSDFGKSICHTNKYEVLRMEFLNHQRLYTKPSNYISILMQAHKDLIQSGYQP